MTTFLTDNFTDTNGTAITAHTPDSGGSWSLHTGTNGAIDNNRAHAGAGYGYWFHSQVATADGESITGVFNLLPPGTTLGLLERCNPASGGSFYMVYWQPDAAGALSFWRKVNGTLTQIKTGATFIPTGSHTLQFLVSGTGATVSLEIKIDGVSKDTYSDTAGNRIVALGTAGFHLAAATSTTGYHLTSITATDSASSSSISMTTPAAGRIHQRSGTVGTVAVAGTYTGTPTTIEGRLVQAGTNTPLSGFDWTTKVASPAGGTFSFAFSSVPQGGWYNVQVRFSNDTAVNGTSGEVGVGVLYALTGQSNSYNWFRSRSTSLTPNALVRVYGNISTWAAPSTAAMAGAIAFGNAMATALSMPVGVLDYGYSGGSMYANWIPVTGTVNRLFTNGVLALDGKLEAVINLVGEGDAAAGRTQAQVYADYGSLISDWRTQFSQAGLPVILATLGMEISGSYTDAQWQEVVNAQIQKCGDTAVYRVDRKDLPLYDTVHPTGPGYETLGVRVAHVAKYLAGVVSYYRGPAISQVRKVDATTFDAILTHFGGTDFTPTSAITEFTVTDGGTPVTVSSAVRQSATRIRLTLASAPSALPVVKYLYGHAPTITGQVFDNSAATLPLEVAGGVTAQNIPSASINLVNAGGTAQSGLSALKWAWFDQVTPNMFGAPTDQGSAETTDGAGLLTVDLPNTTKLSGQVGWLIVTDSDGTTTQSPAHKAFSGPVAVT